ncbi:hypothetical protein PM082_002313 [Marasmius tenuissimus]|nr:hypothetical protein PM082_002313 [Marasmius tenuissimus]
MWDKVQQRMKRKKLYSKSLCLQSPQSKETKASVITPDFALITLLPVELVAIGLDIGTRGWYLLKEDAQNEKRKVKLSRTTSWLKYRWMTYSRDDHPPTSASSSLAAERLKCCNSAPSLPLRGAESWRH